MRKAVGGVDPKDLRPRWAPLPRRAPGPWVGIAVLVVLLLALVLAGASQMAPRL